MYIEPPSSIAIIGAGPIGLEAALYARFLGYNVRIFERGQVADNVLNWGHVRMFSPFRMNASALGLRALAAQDEAYQPPGPEEFLTGSQWLEHYLLPLARSDLVTDGLSERTRVLSITRQDFRKGEAIGDARRAASPFRMLLEDDVGQREEFAEVVIDTSGTFGNHNWMGAGGSPAVRELRCRHRIEYGLPDILGNEKDKYVGRRTLVVGSGYSAATNVVALAELLGEAASGDVLWVTRTREGSDDDAPIARIENDRLPARDELAVHANALAAEGKVQHWSGAVISSIAYDDSAQQFSVQIVREDDVTEHTFDSVIANVGYRPDASLFEELQVQQCYATGGPMKLAAALFVLETSADCLDQQSHGPETLLNPEPNFYILGSKSYGRNSNFLVSIGLQQIRDVFTIIGDRADLDLYKTMSATT